MASFAYATTALSQWCLKVVHAVLCQMFLAPAPVRITQEMAEMFELKLREAELDAPARRGAMSTLMQAEHNTYQEQVHCLCLRLNYCPGSNRWRPSLVVSTYIYSTFYMILSDLVHYGIWHITIN